MDVMVVRVRANSGLRVLQLASMDSSRVKRVMMGEGRVRKE